VTSFKFGLVHAPLTPFSTAGINFDLYGNLIDFHLSAGAEGLALPMHTGESVSLTADERQSLLEFAIKHADTRAPVIAHVSDSGTDIAAAFAAHARQAGAAAIIAAVPYYWTPPQSMLLEHFAAIGGAGVLPFFLYNAPGEMGGAKITTELVLKLLDRLPSFAGLIDASHDWQFMIEVVSSARRQRAAFQLVSATEYMISAGAIGATGVLSSLSNVAPRLVRELYDLCAKERYQDAHSRQTDLAVLYRILQQTGVSGLKAASRLMGRDCGAPRPPLPTLADADSRALAEKLAAIPGISAEPLNWRYPGPNLRRISGEHPIGGGR
jgi:4-hydroxy-tetrahydrodipicolinate synthase